MPYLQLHHHGVVVRPPALGPVALVHLVGVEHLLQQVAAWGVGTAAHGVGAYGFRNGMLVATAEADTA